MMKITKIAIVLFLLLSIASSGVANEDIFSMIRNGDIDGVKEIIEEIEDINIRGRNEATPLHIAVRYGFAEIAELLVYASADVNAFNRYGMTPLHYALLLRNDKEACNTDLFQNKVQVINFLLANDADVNAQDNAGITPLMVLSMLYRGKDTQLILYIWEVFSESYINLNVQDNDGLTALHWAALVGNENVVQILINAGADVNIKTNNGANALWYAPAGGSLCIVLALLKLGVEVNVYAEGITPLHVATGLGAINLFERLEGESFQENIKRLGFSEDIFLQMTKALVEAGADIYAQSENLRWYDRLMGRGTPYHTARFIGSTEVANYLRSVMERRWFWPF